MNISVLWVLIGTLTLLLLPPGIALAAGRVPDRARAWLEPVRPRGWGLLLLYANVPLNTVPRALHADDSVILACSATGGLSAACGALLLAVPPRRRDRDLPGTGAGGRR